VTEPRTLVLGLGNPILRDDGAGWRVVAEVESGLRSNGFSRSGMAEAITTKREEIEFDCAALGGLALMERLIGYERVVLVDAIQTRGGTPGAVYRLTLDDLPTLHVNAAHDATLKAAMELGRRLGAQLPAAPDIAIVAIEAEDVLDFGEGLSPAIEAAVPGAVSIVMGILKMHRGDAEGTEIS
jgi:hydrogenase maturation protease